MRSSVALGDSRITSTLDNNHLIFLLTARFYTLAVLLVHIRFLVSYVL